MLILTGAVLGAIIGSFLATLVVRWPQGRSISRGRSICDGCGVPIGAARLIPIFSYALQRGRAACCGSRIDGLHPLAEIAAAGIGALSFAVAAEPTQALAGALFGWLLLALALCDARHLWLPDRLTGALALTGLAAAVVGIAPPLADRLIGGAAAFAAFAMIRQGYRRLRHREGMGGGDVKLFAAIGLWLGWRMLPLVVLGAALAGLLWCIMELARGRALDAGSSVPFGMFLALAGWAAWMAGALG